MVGKILAESRNFLFAKQKDVLSAATILMLSVAASRLLGLVRDRTLTHFFSEHDIGVYFAAFRLPDSIFEILILGALSSAFIPTFIKYISKSRGKQAWEVTSIVLNLTLLIFIIFAFLIYIFAVPASRSLAPGFNAQETLLMASLTRVLVFAQGFFIISFFITGVLKSFQRFLIPAAAPIFYNLGIITGTVLFADSVGIFAPAFGAVGGAFLHLLVQLPLSLHLGFRPTLSFNFRHPGVKEIGWLAAPRIIELSFWQIQKTAELFFASLISTASYAYLTFASHLGLLPVSLFGVSLAEASLPALSYSSNAKGKAKFKELFLSSYRQILFLTIPFTAALVILRIPLVRLAFGASRFSWESTVLTGYALSAFAVGVFSQSLSALFTRAFYAISDTITPVRASIASIFVNITLMYFSSIVLKLPVWGIALSFALSSMVQLILLGVLLDKRLGFSKLRDLFAPLLKTILAGLVSASYMYVLMKLLDRSAWDKNLSFLRWFGLKLPERWEYFVLDTRFTLNLVILTLLVGLSGFALYLAAAYVLKIEEIKVLRRFLRVFSANKASKFIPPVVSEDETDGHV